MTRDRWSPRAGRTVLSCLLLLAVEVMLAPRARAESAVFRPLPEHASSELERSAQRAAAEALREASVRIIDPADARKRLVAAAQNPCLEVNCASSVLRVLDADMLVAVTVAVDGEVIASLIDARGNHVDASAPSRGSDVALAARAAINRALSKWPTRDLVPIAVDGTPAGATVTIDGQPRGVTPLEVRVRPGRHELVVAMAGYRGWHTSVEAPAGGAAAPRIEVALEREAVVRDAKRTRWGLYGGPALAAAGAVTMAVALGSYAREGCTERAPNDVCVERRHVAGVPVALWTTAGALALAGGVTWFAIELHRARAARRMSTQLDVSWNHLSLRGSF